MTWTNVRTARRSSVILNVWFTPRIWCLTSLWRNTLAFSSYEQSLGGLGGIGIWTRFSFSIYSRNLWDPFLSGLANNLIIGEYARELGSVSFHIRIFGCFYICMVYGFIPGYILTCLNSISVQEASSKLINLSVEYSRLPLRILSETRFVDKDIVSSLVTILTSVVFEGLNV